MSHSPVAAAARLAADGGRVHDRGALGVLDLRLHVAAAPTTHRHFRAAVTTYISDPVHISEGKGGHEAIEKHSRQTTQHEMRGQGNGGTHSTRERALSVAGSSAAVSPSSATVITGSSSGASCAQIAISISEGQGC